MYPVSEKTRSTVEVGAIVVAFIFFITLSFNAGIQYGQIATLQQVQAAQNQEIRRLQDVNTQSLQTLTHIETLVEDMRAAQELKASGASR